MALSGVHVTCCYAGNTDSPDQSYPLVGKILFSQTMARQISMSPSAQRQTPSGTERAFVPAYLLREFYCKPGDKLAWVLA